MMSPLAPINITGNGGESLSSIKVRLSALDGTGATPDNVLAPFNDTSSNTNDNQGLCVYEDTNGNGWFDPGPDAVLQWEVQPTWVDAGGGNYDAILDVVDEELPSAYNPTDWDDFNYFVHMQVNQDPDAAKAFKLTFPTDSIVTTGSSPTITAFDSPNFITMGGSGEGEFDEGVGIDDVYYMSPTQLVVMFDRPVSTESAECADTTACADIYTLSTVKESDSELIETAVMPGGMDSMIVLTVESGTILTASFEDTLLISTEPGSAPEHAITGMPFDEDYPMSPIMLDSAVKISEIQLASSGSSPTTSVTNGTMEAWDMQAAPTSWETNLFDSQLAGTGTLEEESTIAVSGSSAKITATGSNGYMLQYSYDDLPSGSYKIKLDANTDVSNSGNLTVLVMNGDQSNIYNFSTQDWEVMAGPPNSDDLGSVTPGAGSFTETVVANQDLSEATFTLGSQAEFSIAILNAHSSGTEIVYVDDVWLYATGDPSTNLLTNGTLDTWTDSPTNPTSWESVGSGSISRDSSNAQAGTYSLAINYEFSALAGNTAGIAKTSLGTPGAGYTYALTGYVKTGAAGVTNNSTLAYAITNDDYTQQWSFSSNTWGASGQLYPWAVSYQTPVDATASYVQFTENLTNFTCSSTCYLLIKADGDNLDSGNQNVFVDTVQLTGTPAGGNAETEDFVEIYNSSPDEVDLDGFVLKKLNGITVSTLATISSATPLSSGQYYLFGNSAGSYNTSISADASYTGDLVDGDTIILMNPAPNDASMKIAQDIVGLGTTAGAYETNAFGDTISDGTSIERKAIPTSTTAQMAVAHASIGNAFDADDNGYDFVSRATPDPQASTDDVEAPFGGGGFFENTEPEIHHMPLVFAVNGQDLNIPADVYDQDEPLKSLPTVELCFITSDDVWGNEECVNGSIFMDVIFSIGADVILDAASGGGIEYYIHVADSDGGEAFACADPGASSDTSCQAAPFHINISQSAGSKKILGTVYEADCATALGGATVYVEGVGLSGTAESNGSFEITGVPDGMYNLKAKKGGYLDAVIWGIPVTANEPISDGWDFCLNEGNGGQGGDGAQPHVIWHVPEDGMGGAPITISYNDAPILIEMDKPMDGTTITCTSCDSSSDNVMLMKMENGVLLDQTGYDVSYYNEGTYQSSAERPIIAVTSNVDLETATDFVVELTPSVLDTSGNMIEGNRPGGGYYFFFTTQNNAASDFWGNEHDGTFTWDEGNWDDMKMDDGWQSMMGNFDEASGKWAGREHRPPFIFGSIPAPGEWDVPTGLESIVFEFDQALDSSTVTSTYFKLYEINGSEIDRTSTLIESVDLSTNKKFVTMTVVDAGLVVDTEYRLKVLNGVRNESMLTLGDPNNPDDIFYDSDFGTASADDSDAPTIAGSYPEDGATDVPMDFGFVDIGMNEKVTGVSGATVKMKTGGSEVPVKLVNDIMGGSIRVFPKVGLMPGALYSVTLSMGGASGITDMSGNPAVAASTTIDFTLSSTMITTSPVLDFVNCDDYACAVTFSRNMNSYTAVDENRWPNSVLNPSNYTMTFSADGETCTQNLSTGAVTGAAECDSGNDDSNVKITWDYEHNTVKMEGLNIYDGPAVITVSEDVKDVAGNPIDTNERVATVPIENSQNTLGFLGPGGGGMMGPGFNDGPTGFGGYDAKEAGMFGARVEPMNRIAGATTRFFIDYPIGPNGGNSMIDDGGYLKLTFPNGFDISSAAIDTGSANYNDINMDGPGDITYQTSGVSADDAAAATKGGAADDGLTINGQTMTIYFYTDGGETGDPDMLAVDVLDVVNTSIPRDFDTDGYTVEMKTYSAAGTLKESKTSMPFFIGSGGDNSLVVNVTATAAEGTMWLMAESPMTGPMDEEITLSSGTGTKTWASLPDGCYHVFTEPNVNVGSDVYTGNMPEPICLPGSGDNWNSGTSTYTKTMALTKRSTENSAPLKVTVAGTFDAAGEDIDVFAGGPSGFSVVTTTLTGVESGQEVTLYLPSDGDYMVGIGPALPKGAMGGPPPMPDWMPPMNERVVVDNSLAEISNDNDVLIYENGGVNTGLAFTVNGATKQIIGRVVSASTTVTTLADKGDMDVILDDATKFSENDFIYLTDGSAGFGAKIERVSSNTITLTKETPSSVPANAIVYNVLIGAEVNAHQPMGFGGMGAHAQTDAEGGFTLKIAQNGTYEVDSWKDGYIESPPYAVAMKTNSGEVSDGNATADVKLNGAYITTVNPLLLWMAKPDYTISGKITDSSGNPIQNTHVWAENTTNYQGIHGGTDSNGNYNMGVSAGTWTIKSDMPPGTVACGALTKTVTVSAETNDMANQNIQPATSSCYTVSGTITLGGETQPFMPVMIEAWDTINDWPSGGYHRNENTNSDGEFEVPAADGTYRVSSWTPDYGEISTTVVVSGSDQAGDITYQAGDMKTLTFDFVGGAAGMEGFIEAKADDGNSRRGRPVFDLTTDQTMSLPAGEYTVFAGVMGIGPIVEGTAVDLSSSNQTVIVDMSGDTMREVSGTVEDASENPVSGAAIILLDEDTGLTVQTTTESDGTYAVSVKEGDYSIKVEHKNFDTPAKETLTVDGAEGFDFDGSEGAALAERTVSISGTIYESDGSTPMTKGVVFAATDDGKFAKTSLNPDGTYAMPVSDGTWTVTADGGLHSETERGASVVVSGSAVTAKDITLDEDATDIKKTETRALTPSIGASIDDSNDTGVEFTAGTGVLGRDDGTGSVTFEEIDAPTSTTSQPVGNFVDISAKDSDKNDINQLSGAGAEIVFHYTAADLTAADIDDESLLSLTYFDETTGSYMPLDNQAQDETNNTITGYISHLTDIGLTAPLATSGGGDGGDPPGLPGGGGGGGLPVVTGTTIGLGETRTVTLTEAGGLVNLYTGGTMSFTAAGSAHTIVIGNVDVTGESATFTIASDPVTVSLDIGETAVVDLDGDGNDDIEVTLQSITTGSQVQILVASVAQPATTDTETTETVETVKTVVKKIVKKIVSITDYIPYKDTKRVLAKEISAIEKFDDIVGRTPSSNRDWQVIDFVAYGSISDTRSMDERGRLGILDDYQAIYNRLPKSDNDWLDLSKMLSSTTPSRVIAEEVKAIQVFTKIFKRAVDFTEATNEKFVHNVAYRLRGDDRDLTAEKAAIIKYRAIYNSTPNSGFTWAIMRALAYAGVVEEAPVKPTETPVAEIETNVMPELPAERNLITEISATESYTKMIGAAPSGGDWNMVNFIAYGTTAASKDLTAAKRLSVLKNYKSRYNSWPVDESDWQRVADLMK
jgi:hypothetical protein